jgi:16S rRNA (guanine966-N2)-methyltransferase
MRIITGKYRGRKLETPENYDIRPTSDKVKEAVFNILMNDIYGSVCCDLFAGTGNLGIEALSRGAERAYLADRSRDAVRLIRTNLEKCGAQEDAVVLMGDYRRSLNRINEKIDIFFLDPPYREGLYEDCMERIGDLDLLAPDGIILAEHDSRNPLPENCGEFVKTQDRKYGKTTVSIYRRQEDVSGSEE